MRPAPKLNVRMNDTEYAALVKLAASQRMSVAAVIRWGVELVEEKCQKNIDIGIDK